MHIGIDTRLTYYRTGGISTYMRRLVKALEMLDTRNHYTIFQSRKSRKSLSTRFRTAALWTPCHHRLERMALSVELARFRLDVLHSPDFIPPQRGARRHIITVHDLTFLHYPQYLTADARRYYNDQIEWAVRHADHILADSESTKRDLTNMLGVPGEKVSVHMLGVDERFHPLADEAREPRRQALRLPDRYILFVGTFEPRKNMVGLLDAYAQLRGRMPTVPPLLLAGRRGWLFEETLARAEQLRLSDHLIWREDIADDDLPALYSLADVLVMPSFYEGFGFPPLEAMACGTPTVASNRSSLPEVVGDTGLLIDPEDTAALADAVESALTDEQWRLASREAGLQRARTFTWERTAQVALSVYQTCVS
jgi:glycosyltransferase involved in cell wall biosynthesis